MIEVPAQRFNHAGKVVEDVTIGVHIVGRTVFLHIEGQALSKSYSMPFEAWTQLTRGLSSTDEWKLIEMVDKRK